jgi:hypothetical protein
LPRQMRVRGPLSGGHRVVRLTRSLAMPSFTCSTWRHCRSLAVAGSRDRLRAIDVILQRLGSLSSRRYVGVNDALRAPQTPCAADAPDCRGGGDFRSLDGAAGHC